MTNYLQNVDYYLGESLYQAAMDLKDDPKYAEYMLDEFIDEFTDFDEATNVIGELFERIHEMSFYNDNGKLYIQLSDAPVEFGIDTRQFTNDELNQLNITCQVYLDDICTKFKDDTEVEVLLLGRSGRHVCVESNFSNAARYDELCEVQQKLKKKYIDDIVDYSKKIKKA